MVLRGSIFDAVNRPDRVAHFSAWFSPRLLPHPPPPPPDQVVTAVVADTVRQVSQQLRVHVDQQLDAQLLPTVQRSLCLWVPFNALNFTLVPLDYRMLAGGLVALSWNVYLSVISNSAVKPRAGAAAGRLQ